MIATKVLRGLLLPLALLGGCTTTEEPAAPSPGGGGAVGGCTDDASCGAGRACVEGACVEDVPEVVCRHESDPVCGDGALCVAVVDALCAGGDGCAAPTRCAAPVGETEGSFRCATADDCRSGLCHEGICLRLCRDATDCDGTPCVDLALPRGALASFCLPVDEAGAFAPERARCEADRGCAEGQVCRRTSGDPYSPDSRASCAPADPALTDLGGACELGNRSPEGTASPRALAADATCRHNACENACLSTNAVCSRARCTAPCRTAEDCPARRICQVFDGPREDPPLTVRSCFLPVGGCLDERDCCPTRDPDGNCLDGWGLQPTHCAVVAQQGRLLTICEGAPGPAAPGEPCEADEACASGVCLDAASGAGRCAFVCDPDLDRCPELTGDAGSVCTRSEVTVAGVAGWIELCR